MRSLKYILWAVALGTSSSTLATGLYCKSIFTEPVVYHRHSQASVDELLSQLSQQAEKLSWNALILSDGSSWIENAATRPLVKDLSRSIHISLRVLVDLTEISAKPLSPALQKHIEEMEKSLLDLEMSLRPTSSRNGKSTLNSSKLAENYETLFDNGILEKIRSELMKDPEVARQSSSRNSVDPLTRHSEEKRLLDSYSLAVYEPAKTAWLNQLFKQGRFQNPFRFFQKKDARGLPSADQLTISVSRKGLQLWSYGKPQSSEKVQSLLGEYVIADWDSSPQNQSLKLSGPGYDSGMEGLIVAHGLNKERGTYNVTLLTPEGKLHTFSANDVLSITITRFRKDAYKFHQSYADKKVRIRRVTQGNEWVYSAPIEGLVLANDRKSLKIKTSHGEIMDIPTLISETEWLEVKIMRGLFEF